MKYLASFCIACLISISLAGTSFANFKVSPLTVEQDVKPGEVATGTFSVTNLTDESITVTINWFDKTKDPAADWFSLSAKEIVLNGGESIDVPYTVDLPATAQGLYYARVRFAENPPADAVVGIRKAYNFPVRINAEGTEKYAFTVNNIMVSQKEGTEFEVYINNKSNTYIYPTGQITVTSLNRENEVFEMEFNTDKDLIYPDEEYICKGKFIGNMLLPDGHYKADFVINAGTEQWTGSMMFEILGESVTILE